LIIFRHQQDHPTPLQQQNTQNKGTNKDRKANKPVQRHEYNPLKKRLPAALTIEAIYRDTHTDWHPDEHRH
jgi:hypothetical protein